MWGGANSVAPKTVRISSTVRVYSVCSKYSVNKKKMLIFPLLQATPCYTCIHLNCARDCAKKVKTSCVVAAKYETCSIFILLLYDIFTIIVIIYHYSRVS